MNILVCIKQVPDTTEIKIDPVTHTLIRAGVPSIVNPFDGYALEMATRLKESVGGKVVVMSMGPEQAKVALKECLSTGADDAYLISDRAFGGSDTLATSFVLSKAIRAVEKQEGTLFDLIFCGKQAIDGDTGQVGPEMAEHMDYPQITYASDVSCENGVIRVKREYDEGYDYLTTQLPAIITVVKTPFEPRYPSIKSKLAANRKQIKTLNASDIDIDTDKCGLKGSPTKVKKTFVPVNEKNGIKIAGLEPKESANKLVSLLLHAKLL